MNPALLVPPRTSPLDHPCPGTRGCLAALLVVLALSMPAAHAEFLQPVAVVASNGEATQDNVINGFGFEDPGLGSPESLHVTAGSEMWSAIGSIRAQLDFDLGRTVDLTRLYVWNYNAGTDTDWGMKDVEVWVSSDTDPATARFTGIAQVSLSEGGNGAQAFDLVGTEVRLVRLRNTSNWGNGFAIGLAEVRFESGDIAGSVPSVAIQGLKDGDVIPLGSELTLSATVTDRDNDLARVEFFDGDTKLDEKTRAPYSTTLRNLAAGAHTLRVVATDATGKSGWSLVNVSAREVVPGTVVQIDDTRDEGSEVGQIAYTGTWNLAQGNANDPRFLNNDHYSDVRNAYFEVRFVGVKIDIFATVASHHGSANVTIDGGTQYSVSYKAPQRAEQFLVWSSPLLPNREHVLRVTVAGNGVVTADRFDVTQSDTPSDDRATVRRWVADLRSLTLEIEDVGSSRVDTNTIALAVDGVAAPVTIARAGALTTVTHTSAAGFAPGSVHPFRLSAKDTLGNEVGTEATFMVPAPPWPLEGLGEPAGTPGHWSVRQVWNGGRADALVTAVGIAQAAARAGFAGNRSDAQAPVLNFTLGSAPGTSGLFPDELPFPAESQGLAGSDFVTVARAKVRIPRPGDWTVGVHGDDGFGLRVVGHPFASASGLGAVDDHFPEFLSYQVPTGDSNTRGVLKGIAAGDYVFELVHFQRTGGSSLELYAAEGEFLEDTDTGDWALIGGPGGLELVADALPAAPPEFGAIRVSPAEVILEFTSTSPAASHALEESVNLRAWSGVAGASFTATGGNGVRASVPNPSGPVKFYRVRQLP